MERVSIMNFRSRLPALLSGLALAFTVTACGHVDSEQESSIDYEGFAESVAELPAVASVESAAAGEAIVAEISAEASEAALRTTGRRIMRLLDDAGVSYETSPLTIVSGPYTIAGTYGYSEPDGGPYRSHRLDLTALPHLRELPDVASGTLHNGTATVTLTEGTDLHTWVEDAVTRDGRSRVRAYPAQDDSQETESPNGSPGTDGGADAPTADDTGSGKTDVVPVPAESDELEESFTFHLGSEKNADTVQKLFAAADSADAAVVTAEVSSEGEVDADLELESLADLEQLDDVFAGEYDVLTGFTFHTGDGFRLDYGSTMQGHTGQGAPSIGDVLAAHQQIEDLGAALTSVSESLQEAEIEAPDADALRDVAEAVSSSAWPLEPTQRIALSHPDSPDVASFLPAEAWGERVDVLASLWGAGFTTATDRGGSASPDVTLPHGQGPDITTATGRDALVAALRGVDWEGTARITVEHPPCLTFESTADGTALNPHDCQHEASTELSGWDQEVIDAWDATAG
ncbi:hypothetical protein [Brevibacterium jeotgali]|uniref:Uncharacterized protein n=1 Tax=Brevibacterium jeotgali TaxID=1262550 RepID=A0A2H1L1Z1_9MICO|nr:hypothetical protein [Brevibacterium jeotgali]TWC01860.1 hypothetical protein FB108_0517 [Brevibacterium jeotgali]SMY10790.1 hypothetical protein BJEO58_00365 [Brevibacterium jeotgali]